MIGILSLTLCASAGTLVEFRQGTAQAYESLPIAWATVEPVAGQWDFSAPDKVLESATLPAAATLFPGQFRGAAPPDAADSFRPVLGPRAKAYVERVVQRYGDRVDVWRVGERWNLEGPDPLTQARVGPGGWSTDAMAQFISAVTVVVRANDPEARVIGPQLPGTTQSTIASELTTSAPDYWAESGELGAMVRSRMSAWLVNHAPLFWVIPDDESGQTTRATVGLLQTHLADAVTIERIPNLAYEQYGYRFTRQDGALRWVYWGQGEVTLGEPWPKAVTSVRPGDDGRHAWRGVGDTLKLSEVPVLLRN